MGDLGAPDVVIFGAEFDEKGDGSGKFHKWGGVCGSHE